MNRKSTQETTVFEKNIPLKKHFNYSSVHISNKISDLDSNSSEDIIIKRSPNRKTQNPLQTIKKSPLKPSPQQILSKSQNTQTSKANSNIDQLNNNNFSRSYNGMNDKTTRSTEKIRLNSKHSEPSSYSTESFSDQVNDNVTPVKKNSPKTKIKNHVPSIPNDHLSNQQSKKEHDSIFDSDSDSEPLLRIRKRKKIVKNGNALQTSSTNKDKIINEKNKPNTQTLPDSDIIIKQPKNSSNLYSTKISFDGVQQTRKRTPVIDSDDSSSI